MIFLCREDLSHFERHWLAPYVFRLVVERLLRQCLVMIWIAISTEFFILLDAAFEIVIRHAIQNLSGTRFILNDQILVLHVHACHQLLHMHEIDAGLLKDFYDGRLVVLDCLKDDLDVSHMDIAALSLVRMEIEIDAINAEWGNEEFFIIVIFREKLIDEHVEYQRIHDARHECLHRRDILQVWSDRPNEIADFLIVSNLPIEMVCIDHEIKEILIKFDNGRIVVGRYRIDMASSLLDVDNGVVNFQSANRIEGHFFLSYMDIEKRCRRSASMLLSHSLMSR